MDKIDTRRAAAPIAAVAATDGRSRLILPRRAGDPDCGLAVSASRRRVLTLGLAVGLGGVGALDAVAAKRRRWSQGGWQFCSKCLGLWYAPSATGDVCPAGGGHNPSSVTNYTLFYGKKRKKSEQHDWRYCDKCAGLWYAGSRTTSICPAGGAHNRDPRGNYFLLVDQKRFAAYDKDWRYCHRCKGLWYSASGVREGACPAFGPHRLEGSGNYSLLRTPPA